MILALDDGRRKGLVVPSQRRLTHPPIPIKLEESNRGCPDHREGAAIPFCSSPLGGRPIGRTPDSDSGYPGSSPGLPAKNNSHRANKLDRRTSRWYSIAALVPSE